eukprot:Sdes_comp10335_c0_seq1m1979
MEFRSVQHPVKKPDNASSEYVLSVNGNDYIPYSFHDNRDMQSIISFDAEANFAAPREHDNSLQKLSEPIKSISNSDINNVVPSKVLHIRNLPNHISKQDILNLLQSFSTPLHIILLPGKGQALIEMNSISAASDLIQHFQNHPPVLQNRPIYFQFSKRKEILSTQQNSHAGNDLNLNSSINQEPCNILLVSVHNMIYPITIDILHSLFSKFGFVEKIITFKKKNIFQAMIQFSNVSNAQDALRSLNHQSIFKDSCYLKIIFSTAKQLVVKMNNDRSRDYTFMNPKFQSNHTNNVIFDKYDPGAMYSAPHSQTIHHPHSQPQPLYSPPQHQHHPHSGQQNCVLICSNLNQDRVTCDALFTLFGVYADVQRIKILFNKKNTALIEVSNSFQAQLAIHHLNGQIVYDQELHVSLSHHTHIILPKEDSSDESYHLLNKDYSSSLHHRFRLIGSKNYKNIASPSDTLHLSNISHQVTEEELLQEFSSIGTVISFRFFPIHVPVSSSSDQPQQQSSGNGAANAMISKKMAFLRMKNVQEAIEALISMHNHVFYGNEMKVSFSKTLYKDLKESKGRK